MLQVETPPTTTTETAPPTTTDAPPTTTENIPTTTEYVPTTSGDVHTTTAYVHTTTEEVATTSGDVHTTTEEVATTTQAADTLGFYLNGVAYPDGSTVLRTDIGEDDAALQCITDSTTCCRNNIGGEVRAGEFFFPGGIQVPLFVNAIDGYFRNRDSQLIRLNRQTSGVITGQFRCNIPSASGVDVDLFINISEFNALYINNMVTTYNSIVMW